MAKWEKTLRAVLARYVAGLTEADGLGRTDTDGGT